MDTKVPSLVRIKEKGQLTLPAKLRARHGLRIGDYVEVREEDGHIMLVLQDVVPRDPVVDAMIAEGLADIRAGRTAPFHSKKQFDTWLTTKEGKRFLAHAD